MDRLHVATLNILNLADRWPERLPLILADMAALQPDLLGLQEVVYVMQQDRLIGAAGEGRYGAVRGWAGRPEYGNSLLVREPLEATDVERLELGLNRAAHRAVVRLPGGATVLIVVTHLHHLGPDEAPARRADRGRSLEWLDGAPATDARVVVGDFNADPARTDGDPDAGRRLSIRLRRGERRRTRPSPGRPGSRRPRWTRTAARSASTTSGSAARSRSWTRASSSIARIPRTRRSTRAITSASRPISRSGRGLPMAGRTLRLAHRGDWRVAPENSLAAMRAAMAIAACDGLEFDVRSSSDGVPVVIHDATLERVQGRPEAVADLTAAALAALDVPTLAAVLEAADRRAFLDVELKTVPGPGIIEILAAGRGPQLSGAVISSFDEAALAKIGRLAPSWPRWLNSETLDRRRTSSAPSRSDASGSRPGGRPIDAESMELGPRRRPGRRRLHRPRPRDVRPARQPGRDRGLRGGRRPRRLSGPEACDGGRAVRAGHRAYPADTRRPPEPADWRLTRG